MTLEVEIRQMVHRSGFKGYQTIFCNFAKGAIFFKKQETPAFGLRTFKVFDSNEKESIKYFPLSPCVHCCVQMILNVNGRALMKACSLQMFKFTSPLCHQMLAVF